MLERDSELLLASTRNGRACCHGWRWAGMVENVIRPLLGTHDDGACRHFRVVGQRVGAWRPQGRGGRGRDLLYRDPATGRIPQLLVGEISGLCPLPSGL